MKTERKGGAYVITEAGVECVERTIQPDDPEHPRNKPQNAHDHSEPVSAASSRKSRRNED